MQDREDVKDSKARVDHMHYNMKAGNKELAFEYAITKKERQVSSHSSRMSRVLRLFDHCCTCVGD